MISQNSLRNLKPAKKGEIRSPGRPKGSLNRVTIYDKYLSEKIEIEGIKKTRWEFILEAFFTKAINGDSRILIEIIKMEIGKNPESGNQIINIINSIKGFSDEELRMRVVNERK
ncbi:MAG: hypothetical protein JXB50_14350 [Spirochaetes bacterium]|nr:hypothetical protein [Spirochaetota bacterium]